MVLIDPALLENLKSPQSMNKNADCTISKMNQGGDHKLRWNYVNVRQCCFRGGGEGVFKKRKSNFPKAPFQRALMESDSPENLNGL